MFSKMLGPRVLTDCDSELVGAHNGTPNPFRSSLTLIHWDHCTDQADTEASEESSCNEHWSSSRCSLQNDAKVEDCCRCCEQAPSSTKNVRKWRSHESTEESTGTEDRDYQRVLRSGNFVIILWIGKSLRTSEQHIFRNRHMQKRTVVSNTASQGCLKWFRYHSQKVHHQRLRRVQ